MEKDFKIGVIVADVDEYSPFEEAVLKLGAKEYNCYNKKGLKFKMGNATVLSVLCGIGKVNASAVAMYLADIGCNVILNFGLSGGISAVKRGDYVIADRFLEHDFDLTGLGYKPCEKPGQKYIYDADKELINILKCHVPNAVLGTAVCGDCFVSSDTDRLYLKKTFGAVACDMETAAIASVCDMTQIPFVALRRISDDAGDDAMVSYREMNTDGETVFSDIFLNCLSVICKQYAGFRKNGD